MKLSQSMQLFKKTLLATGVATSAVFLYGCDDGAIKAPTITAQQPTTVTAFANGDSIARYSVDLYRYQQQYAGRIGKSGYDRYC